MKKGLFIKIVCVALTAVMLLGLCACTKKESENEKIILTVGDYDVTYDLYRYYVMNYKADGVKSADKLHELAKEAIVNLYATFALAEKYNIEQDNEYINALVDRSVYDAQSEAGGEKDFKKGLKENYMSENVFRILALQEELKTETYSAMVREGHINTDKSAVLDIINGDEFICVKQILVMSTSSSKVQDDMVVNVVKEHTDEEAEEIAGKAYERALAGEDFDALVGEYGESLFMFGNKYGYYLCRGMWEKVNEDAAFSLELGQVSEPIKSDAGWSVFKRCEKDSAYIEEQYDMISSDWFGACYVKAEEEMAKELMPSLEETSEFDEINIEKMK